MAKSGQELDIYIDLLTDEEYQRVKESADTAGRLVDEVFRGSRK